MKKLKKDIGHMVGSGVLIGAGATAHGALGVDVGLGNFATFMGPMATVSGAGTVVRMTRKLKPKHRW
jgi:hypothetical protein